MVKMKMLVIAMMSRIYVAFLFRRIRLAVATDHTRSTTLTACVRADSHCVTQMNSATYYARADSQLQPALHVIIAMHLAESGPG